MKNLEKIEIINKSKQINENKEQIVIYSLDEVDKYKDKLKEIKIYVCNTACGKSYLCNLDDRFYDLDSYRSFLLENNVENYEDATIPKMYEVLAGGKIVLNAAHGHFLNYLEQNKIPFVYMYSKPETQKEYIERMRHRGSTEEFIQRFGSLISNHYQNRTKDKRGTFKIEMNSKEFVSDYLWKVFGTHKKYVQSHNFDKNKYKIVFTDLDNTLLNRKTEITSFTKKTIDKIKHKVPFVFASARMYFSLKPFNDELKSFLHDTKLHNKKAYSICCNGALIMQNDGEILYEKPLKKENIELFFDYFEENLPKKCEITTFLNVFERSNIKDLKQFIKENNIFKIEIFDSASNLAEIKKSLPKEFSDKFEIVNSCDTILVFLEKGVTKKNAVEFLLKRLNISKEEAIAFGDNENDIEMIKYVGCGIAVCNATDEVKKSAKFITDSNNDDGVAKALNKIFDL